MSTQRTFILLAGLFALTAVILGAFGAHALQSRLESADTQATWDTAVNYQMWHALALLTLANYTLSGRTFKVALYCLSLGIPLFSGSLYWLALDGPRWLGPITPLGGLLFIIGWASVTLAAFKMRNE
ncbi:DUF423 domain-containing protein [Coraliomargarita algicola]|uniref:DUF423 domain-containing protein n=1 Tax=Coraliomargarita algicola TaxID=3092156 RepID=A0ABZ0RY56_9BACT|nr:DUF423 domain-containing protein [Coraliomargarita sp. J2-16]WPJ97939.1 DUF423 domain-containing protein [Coraliomargarita sp. J2-16]